MRKPRRAAKRWLEGAPDWVLDCFDNKGRTFDRYRVLFGGPYMEEYAKRGKVPFLGMSDYPRPDDRLGFSQWGEYDLTRCLEKERVRWLDLPDYIRNHVIDRAGFK